MASFPYIHAKGNNILRNCVEGGFKSSRVGCIGILVKLYAITGLLLYLLSSGAYVHVQQVDAKTVREVCSRYLYDKCPVLVGIGEDSNSSTPLLHYSSCVTSHTVAVLQIIAIIYTCLSINRNHRAKQWEVCALPS